jgi:hypothetical protein
MRASTPLAIALMLLVFAYRALQGDPYLTRASSTFHLATSAPSQVDRNAVTVWYPTGRCSGVFTSVRAPDSADSLPYVLLREAVPDRRYASLTSFRKRQRTPRPFLLIILFVTAHISVKLQPNASVNSSEHLAAQVDHVLHVNPYVLKPGPYKSGKKTRYGQEVTEWQVIVSLSSASDGPETESSFAALLHAARETKLHLTLPMHRYDSVPVSSFEASISLSCVLGWDYSVAFRTLPRFRSGNHCGNGVTGAVALAGSALHGEKRKFEKHYKEVAHFAARALLGPMRFDSVRSYTQLMLRHAIETYLRLALLTH